MAEDRPTLGELTRRVQGVEKGLDGKVSKDVYQSDKDANTARHSRTEKDIEQLYGRVRTFVWLVLGAVAGGVVAEVIKSRFPHG